MATRTVTKAAPKAKAATKTKAAAKTKTTAAAKAKTAAKTGVAAKTKTAVKAKPATKTAAKAVSTVTLRHLGTELSETHEMTKKQTNAVLDDFVALVTKHLKKGDRIRIGGLGILQVRKRPARLGRNPATGEQIKIKASKKVAFRAAKDLKEQI